MLYLEPDHGLEKAEQERLLGGAAESHALQDADDLHGGSRLAQTPLGKPVLLDFDEFAKLHSPRH
eukprot:SAG11_NODE_34_length_22265_cov_11.264730_13_plen_65_part_00